MIFAIFSKKLFLYTLAATVALFLASSSATTHATTITFSGLSHGEILGSQFAPFLTVSAVNPNRSHDLAIVFDTTEVGTSDPDLEGPPWAGGNLAAAAVVLGNAAIIAENDGDANNDDIIDDPDDEGSRPAGSMTFDFTASTEEFTVFGFDIIDIEGIIVEESTIDFFDGNTPLGSVNFSEFTTAGPLFDPTIAFGNNTANRIGPYTIGELGVSAEFNKVVFNLGGSSAIDNLFVIPEPSSWALAATSLVTGFIAIRRRRRA